MLLHTHTHIRMVVTLVIYTHTPPTFLKGGHSPSVHWFMVSLGSASVRNTPAVLSLYMGYRQTPDASQKRTVPSSCLGEREGGY